MKKIYFPTLLFILIILVLLPIIKIPITSSSRGVIRSYTEDTKLISVVSGRIIKTSLNQNNQLITKGDTLLVVTAEQLETQKNLQNNQSSDYNAQLSDLNKLVVGNYLSLETGQYQRELSAMREKIAQINSQLKLAEKDFSRAKKLFEQDVFSQADYEKNLFNVENLKRQISTVKEQQIAQWQAQKREVEREIRSLDAESNRINQESKNYIITAPISGRLINFSGIQIGNYIIQGQEIGGLSPDKSIIVETYVSPKEIGFIHPNQNVKLQMDTYNYNQWGLLTGKVIQVDQNVTVDQQTGDTFFRVLCSMDKNYLQLKNGYKGNIEKGMTLTTRFYLIDRTLWQLLFDRADDWFNPRLKK